MKKIITTLTAIMLVLAMLVMLPACKKSGENSGETNEGGTTGGAETDAPKPAYTTPKEYLAYSFGKTAEALPINTQGVELAEKVIKGGSVEVDATNAIPTIKRLFAPQLPIDSLSGKIYYSEGKSAMVGSLGLYGDKADMSIFTDSDKLVFSTNLLDKAYGVDFKNAEANFKGSYIAGLLGDDFNSAMSDFDVEAYTKIVNDLAKQLEKYYTLAESTFDTNTKIEMTDIEGGGKTVTITADTEAVEKIIRDIFNSCKSDAELKAAIEAFGTLVGEKIEFNLEEKTEDLEDLISELKEAKVSFKYTVTTNSSDVVVKYSIRLEATENGEVGAVTVDIDMSKENEFSVNFDFEGAAESEEAPAVKLAYTVTSNTDAGYEANLTLTVKDKTLKVLEVSYTPASGDYNVVLTVPKGGEEVKLAAAGKYKLSADQLVFSVDSITADEAATINLGITVTVKANDTMPEAPTQYTEILKMTEQDFSGLLSELIQKDVVSKLMADIMAGQSGTAQPDMEAA